MRKYFDKISSWRPRYEKLWLDNGDGSFTAHIYTDDLMVKVFTFVGDDRQRAGKLHHATLPKWYHPRWLRRLAYRFAHQVIHGGAE